MNLFWAIPFIWHFFKSLRLVSMFISRTNLQQLVSSGPAGWCRVRIFFHASSVLQLSRHLEPAIKQPMSLAATSLHFSLTVFLRWEKQRIWLLRKRLARRILYTHFVIYLESKRRRHVAVIRVLRGGIKSEQERIF